ncbi:ROK family protein [Cellulomonas shaoxiangyii]|uniref:ROK family protein n=1 Tax=Cellulomonas shaoxiangyii TaxID=2566013 RepID=A0A4P7SNC5_9CELL|nr:ROK family protein [Cellulomonas shaoxiangyii]QCB94103.1 ROK family protein [Cellulomonas shaoxiangyii]TGY83735.1 ROK family protein [Cellulomonas shaoxiangyii]
METTTLGAGGPAPLRAGPAGAPDGVRAVLAPARPPDWAVGVDVGGTKVLAVLLDGDGRVARTHRASTVPGPDGLLDVVATAVQSLATAHGVPLERLAGVGIGIPGVVDPLTGTLEHAVNVGVDRPFALAAAVSAVLGGRTPVRVENDLNVAVLGAAHTVPGPDRAGHARDLAFLALGTGVAAGLLLDGQLRRGTHRAAGEVGHLTLVPDGLACKCGQRGCVEQYASGSALDAAWPSTDGRPAPAALFEAAAAGDPAAVRLRDRYAWAVGAAVRILVLTCDVDRVVVGGGVSNVGEPLLQAVRRALDAEAAGSPFLASLRLADRVRLAPAGVPVGAVGAALVGRGEVV